MKTNPCHLLLVIALLVLFQHECNADLFSVRGLANGRLCSKDWCQGRDDNKDPPPLATDEQTIQAFADTRDAYESFNVALKKYAEGGTDSTAGRQLREGDRVLFLQYLAAAAAAVGNALLGSVVDRGLEIVIGEDTFVGSAISDAVGDTFGKKDENGALVSETDTEILAEIGKLSVQLDGIEEQLGEGFAEISKQITDGLSASVDAVKVDAAKDNLDSITLRLSNLESRFNAFTTAGLTNLALEEQRVEFKNLCNAPNFAPEDIFRELYSHACTTCNAIQGGSKSLQYFLDLFKNGANKEGPDDAKRFRDGFGVVIMSALSRTMWMHTVCPPATDGLPRAEDVVWGTRLQEMAVAFQEVAVSLSKAEEEIEHRLFRTKKDTNLCMNVGGTLEECVLAGKPSVLWKHEEDGTLRSKLGPYSCLAGRELPLKKEVRLQLSTCDGSMSQKWDLEQYGVIRTAEDPTLCVTVVGGTVGVGRGIWLWPCASSGPPEENGQTWS